jgi:hypothetical protein
VSFVRSQLIDVCKTVSDLAGTASRLGEFVAVLEDSRSEAPTGE